jgi:DNA topoisomerase-3
VLGGRLMPDKDIVAIIQGKTVGPFSDFRSKKGKPFTASVRLKKNKIDFIFANATDDLDIDAIKQTKPLGISPVDGSEVFATPNNYMSLSALEGDKKKGLQIGKIILSKELSPEHINQLLTHGKTELIKGFISKKRRPFDAFLHLDNKGKITFSFPPRKTKKYN